MVIASSSIAPPMADSTWKRRYNPPADGAARGGRRTVHIEYEDVDSDDTPLGQLTLRRYRAETGEVGYEVSIDGHFLMASHGAHSERAMAELALERRAGVETPLTVLVGGLGAGHTLRAALDLPGVHRVVVSEIGGKVVEWNRRYFAAVNGGAVDDPRVELAIGDLAHLVRADAGRYDLMLLDVDNGPGWLAAPGNEWLYGVDGLQACRAALRPGGVLAVWSPQRNPTFLAALRQVFPQVDEEDTTARGREVGEPGDVIYLALANC
jgi:spermidine synthase